MDVMDSISIKKTAQSRISSVDFNNLDFGAVFSDHQFEVRFENGAWSDPKIIPYGPIEISPACSALHYGQAVFEGMKAFQYADGRINIFRPDRNYDRFAKSCERISMAIPKKEHFMEGLKELILLDRSWVPKEKFKALYLRPFMFASDPVIRLQSSRDYRFMIITSPVGNYYKEGINPVALTTMPEYVRAVLGGIGEAKAAGNYAASLKPAKLAQSQGFTQVLWLDAKEHLYVEEVGTMNIFFMIGNTLVTPNLSGSILPGITRDSVLFLARKEGMNVEERPVSIHELMSAYRAGDLKEVFGAGTAAVISPVGRIHHQGEDILLGTTMGPVAKHFYDSITGIQNGDLPDPNNWCHLI
jgi:branched-chain amino acid aminotransferase